MLPLVILVNYKVLKNYFIFLITSPIPSLSNNNKKTIKYF